MKTYLLLISSLLALSLPLQASAYDASAIERKAHSALQCVSQFGQVAGLSITDADEKGGELYIRGQYTMVGFWGRSPGTFKAGVDSDNDLTWMTWVEPNNGGSVSDYCLN